MVYITHISSKSSIFETLRVNKSTNACPILVSIEYSRVFLLVLSANTRASASIDLAALANIRTRECILVTYLGQGGACRALPHPATCDRMSGLGNWRVGGI